MSDRRRNGLILLLVLGLGLLTADVLLHRLGPLTAGGLASFTAGSVLLYGGVSEAVDVSPWLVAGAVDGCFVYYGFELTVDLRSRPRRVGLVATTASEARSRPATRSRMKPLRRRSDIRV